MTDMATLLAQYETLKRAYRSGVRSVTHDGKTILYASAEEMRAGLASLRSEIARESGTPDPTILVVRSSKSY